MIAIDTIRVTKDVSSKKDLSEVKLILEKKLKTHKLSIISVGWYDKEKEEVKLLLNKPIPLYRMCKIIYDLDSMEHIFAKEFTWRSNKEGPRRRGTMDIIIS